MYTKFIVTVMSGLAKFTIKILKIIKYSKLYEIIVIGGNYFQKSGRGAK